MRRADESSYCLLFFSFAVLIMNSPVSWEEITFISASYKHAKLGQVKSNTVILSCPNEI